MGGSEKVREREREHVKDDKFITDLNTVIFVFALDHFIKRVLLLEFFLHPRFDRLIEIFTRFLKPQFLCPGSVLLESNGFLLTLQVCVVIHFPQMLAVHNGNIFRSPAL